MAAAADMFEQGVKLQVLKKGTLFAQRANYLYELYKKYDSLDDIPDNIISNIENKYFLKTIKSVWEETCSYYINKIKDPSRIEKANNNPKLKLCMICKWYLSQSSVWANNGVDNRKPSYQIWCGPAIGSYNDWVKGSDLDPEISGKFPSVVDINLKLMGEL